MSESVEQLLDPWELFRSKERYSQAVSFTGMPYVIEAQQNSSGSADVIIEITQQADEKLILKINIKTSLTLQCQRCLGDLEEQLNIDSERLLVKSESELGKIVDDDSDVLICEPTLDIFVLVQEEILLAMPMIAKHESCHFDYKNVKEAEKETHQPFADLKNLLN